MPDFYPDGPDGPIYDIDALEYTYLELFKAGAQGVLDADDFKIDSFEKDVETVDFVKIVMKNGDIYINTFEKIQQKVLQLAHDLMLTHYFIGRRFAILTDEPSEYNNVKFVKSFAQNNTDLETELLKRLSDAFDTYLDKLLEQVHHLLTH
jgi:hypothetical protein